jgi:hypothetical protein
MMIGYLLESFLGFTSALMLELARNQKPRPPATFSMLRRISVIGTCVFFDCAVFFAISIQIAAIFVLARKDFGISAASLGGFTVEITWAVAILSILPLLCPLVLLRYCIEETLPVEIRMWTSERRYLLRFFLFSICWMLFLYPFISRMIGSYAPSQIGAGAGEGGTTIVTDDEWSTLTNLCFTNDVQLLSDQESQIQSAFGLTASLVVSVYLLVQLVWLALERKRHGEITSLDKQITHQPRKSRVVRWTKRLFMVLILLLSISQIWTVFRIRTVQEALVIATGNVYTDNQWSFGQVVAVVIFAPVAVEVGHAYC